jgi:hypothetical protein
MAVTRKRGEKAEERCKSQRQYIVPGSNHS